MKLFMVLFPSFSHWFDFSLIMKTTLQLSHFSQVIFDRKYFSFLVQVIDRGHLNAVGRYAEGRVLDISEFLNKEW